MPYFRDYARRFTDLPLLVTLRERGDGYTPDRFLTASDLGDPKENPDWKTVILDELHRPARDSERVGRVPLERGKGPLEPSP